MFDPEGEAPPATPAATLVIFRNCPEGGPPQLLMVQRSKEMRFAGGAAVFPGGRVDPADYELAEAHGASDDEHREELAARIASIRETLEETGLAVGLHQRPSLEEALAARAHLLEVGTQAPVLEAMNWTLDLDGLIPFARGDPSTRKSGSSIPASTWPTSVPARSICWSMRPRTPTCSGPARRKPCAWPIPATSR